MVAELGCGTRASLADQGVAPRERNVQTSGDRLQPVGRIASPTLVGDPGELLGQRGGMRSRGVGQSVQIVAAFQNGNEASLRVFAGDVTHESGKLREVTVG